MNDPSLCLPAAGRSRARSALIRAGRAAAVAVGAALLALLLLPGCTQHARVICEPLQLASRGLFGDAVAALDGTDEAESADDRFLYHVQRGHLLHLAGRFQESNVEFERAGEVARELEPWSVSETITDYTFNEAVRAYAGEDYERAYIHYYMALNYLGLGDLNGAVIECRRLDEIFRELDARYEEGTERYQDDGFIRYLSSLLYESLGRPDDAFIDMEIAVRAYEGETGAGAGIGVPSSLLRSYVCLGEDLGRDDRVVALVGQHDFDCPRRAAGDDRAGPEIVVLIESGWAPYKHEEALRVPIVRRQVPKDYWERGWLKLDAVVKIAVPAFESVPRRNSEFAVAVERVSDDGGAAVERAVHAERVQDVDALARWTLARRMPALVARSAIRATVKTVAVLKAQHDSEAARESRETGREGTSFWRWLADVLVENIVPVAVSETEQADTRSWITLPSEIWMARIPARPGEYELTLEPDHGPPVFLGTAVVREGEKTFLWRRVFEVPHPIKCEND